MLAMRSELTTTISGVDPPTEQWQAASETLELFRFFANKNLVTGEGGMIVTNREDFAGKARLLRSHGMTSLTWDRHRGHASTYNVVSHGYNYRLDEVHGALGRAQLKKLPGNNERRRKLLHSYKDAIDSLNGWVMPFGESIEASSDISWWPLHPTLRYAIGRSTT